MAFGRIDDWANCQLDELRIDFWAKLHIPNGGSEVAKKVGVRKICVSNNVKMPICIKSDNDVLAKGND